MAATNKPTQNTGVMDVSAPSTSTPSASSRPILVTSRPIMQRDPMVTGTNDNGTSSIEKSAEPITESNTTSKHVKEIVPITPTSDSGGVADNSINETKQSVPATDAVPVDSVTPSPQPNLTMSETIPPKVPESTLFTDSQSSDEDTAEPTVAQAAADARQTKITEDADTARLAEIEKLVEDETYFVPIVAVQYSRNQTLVLELIAVVMVLALVAADILLDTGILKYSGVPHTNFFR
jgi:hypothetical protein